MEEKILVSDTYLSAFRTTEQVGQPGQQFVKVDHDVRAGGFDALADEQDASGECPSQYEVRSALAKCGLTTKHIESLVRVLSGGEQAKVRLCKLINRETNILLLDEPTNHLDVDAKEELKRALKEYKGAILLVCHEPDFYDGLVDKIWNLEEFSLLAL